MCGTSQLLGIRDYELGTGNMMEDVPSLVCVLPNSL